MGTSPENWDQIKSLFDAAIELDPNHRYPYIESKASDSRVRDEVMRLLAEHDNAGAFLSVPVFADMGSPLADRGALLAPGDLLDGKFKIVRLLAQGGMGQVWLAEQTVPLQRQVVVKLIREGIYGEDALQRFRAERQSLAIMEHPFIAKVFDAGTTPVGQPYFVMEYVPGLAITSYCDENKLNTRRRLELFVRVCEGVQHAHLKAIIHRDLKPANILIVEVDGKPAPRIIDFGIAKEASGFASESGLTQTGGFVGTPGYLSPEQIDPRAADVDTRTDVYSLGAVLYVLLAGSTPFDIKRWEKQPLDEMLRHLREDDPPRPSTKVSQTWDTSTAIAAARGTDPRNLVSSLRGDLDWITMKALEKDRTRRYNTPLELAADIESYLRNEPVLARPAGAAYRVGKYVRRHRIGVSVAAAIFVLLAGFTTMQAVQLRRITQERDRANRERDRASRITDFMKSMFKVSDPSEARGNSITAREILDKASGEVVNGLEKDPEIQGQMLTGMGDIYESLGLYGKSELLLRKAVDVFAFNLGPDHRLTLRSKHDFGGLLKLEGHYEAAVKLDREVLAGFRRTLGPQDPDTLASMLGLATVLNDIGRSAEAEKLGLEALEGDRRVFGPEHIRTLSAMNQVGLILYNEGRYADAEELHRQALEISRRVLGSDHPITNLSVGNLANALFMQGKVAEAESCDRQALAANLRVFGQEHPSTLESMNNLANALYAEKKFGEAESYYNQTLQVRRRVLGSEHPITLTSMGNLAITLDAEGRHREAETLLRQTVALSVQPHIFGPDHPQTITFKGYLGGVLAEEHHYAEAEKILREALDVQRRVSGPEAADTALAKYNLAAMLGRQGRRDEAFSLLNESVDHGLPGLVDLGMDKDSDLESLHGDPRFGALVAHAREKAAATAKQKSD